MYGSMAKHVVFYADALGSFPGSSQFREAKYFNYFIADDF